MHRGHAWQRAASLAGNDHEVGKNVAGLEGQPGVHLSTRSARQLHLTVEGEAFRVHAAAALRALDETVARIGSTGGTAVGWERISVGASVRRRHVPPLLPALAAG